MSEVTDRAGARTRTLRTRLTHSVISLVVGMLYQVSRFARCISGRRRYVPGDPADVLLTGTFNSSAWIMAFLRPIAMASRCRNVIIVTTFPVQEIEGVTVVYPSEILRRVIGDVPARLLSFVWQAVRRRPLVVGGFHISINALVAEFAGSLCGGRSLYICVGGPIEVIDGGLWGESRFFGKLRHADAVVERKILRSVRQFDVIASMGNKAVDYFRQQGVPAERLRIITGGIDARHFEPSLALRDTDIVFVGRLVEIKCVDILLHAVRVLADRGIDVRARIVGDGPMETSLRELAADLNIDTHVKFVGFVKDVFSEVSRARCFVLTSRSEGLSLALTEAMLAGAVPVVADVGDLGELVRNDCNGYLVDSRDPTDFADRIESLLSDDERLARCSRAASSDAKHFDIHAVAERWDQLIESLNGRYEDGDAGQSG